MNSRLSFELNVRHTRATATALLCLAALACDDPQLPNTPQTIMVASNATVAEGDTVRLLIKVLDQRGQSMDSTALEFLSSDSSVVQVDSSGLLYGAASGRASVALIAGAARADVTVNVTRTEGGWSFVNGRCGVWHTGRTYCWTWLGENGSLTPPYEVPGPEFVNLAAGRGHACGLTKAGEAYCWGVNEFGQVGDGTRNDQAAPVRVAGNIIFTAITVGVLHTCGLDREGSAWCWGADRTGQLGRGGSPPLCGSPCSLVPARVSGDMRFRAIAAGGQDRVGQGAVGRGFTCALDESGKAYCWGYNEFGAVGDSTDVDRNIPVAVAGTARFRTLTSGALHTCALDRTTGLFCWGLGSTGQLGVPVPGPPESRCFAGDISYFCARSPQEVASSERWRAVAAGGTMTCGINLFGAAFCWGDNRDGQIGNGVQFPTGSERTVRTPSRVVGGLTFSGFGAYYNAVCGKAADGKGYCWGGGSATPVRIPDPQ